MAPSFFNLHIYHGGRLVRNNAHPRVQYVGGRSDTWENIDPERFSKIEILKCLREVGYVSMSGCYYLRPNKNTWDGLVPLKTDDDVIRMVEKLNNGDEVNVYVEHPINKPVYTCEPVEDPREVVDVDVMEDSIYTDRAGVETESDDVSVGEGESENVGDCDEGDQSESDSVAAADDESYSSPEFLYEYESDSVDVLDSENDDSGDSENEVKRRKDVPRGPVHKPGQKMEDVRLELGMQFSSLSEFKTAVKDYAIHGRFQVRFVHNDKTRCHLKCKGSNTCPWKIWCSQIKGESTFQIKTYVNTHSCSRMFVNKIASADWLASKIIDRVRLDPKIRAIDLVQWISETMQLDIGVRKAHRAKRKAIEIIEGSTREQYSILRDYCSEIREKNVGSTCIVQVDRLTADSPPVFKRIYICYAALRRGFLDGCRPLIGLDGCFLKGHYKGQLLTAVGQDANSHIYPIAWAIVLVENADNWAWFLEHLMNDLSCNRPWTFISDQQKGLEHVFSTSLRDYEHRICAKHVYSNFKKDHKGVQLQRQFWKLVRATTIQEFDFEMVVMKSMDDGAWKWLDDRRDKLWSRCRFGTVAKNDIKVNNISESYNSKILKHRGKPIISLLEELRKDAMRTIVKHRTEMERVDGILVPVVKSRIQKHTKYSRKWQPMWSGDREHQLFEVTYTPHKYVIHTGEKKCSCRLWDLTGIPCCHAIAALLYAGKNIEDNVSEYYTKERYLKGYEHIIHPLNGMMMYPKSHSEPIMPPHVKFTKGRPKQKRRRGEGENANAVKLRRAYPIVKCGKCGGHGHNKRTCKSVVGGVAGSGGGAGASAAPGGAVGAATNRAGVGAVGSGVGTGASVAPGGGVGAATSRGAAGAVGSGVGTGAASSSAAGGVAASGGAAGGVAALGGAAGRVPSGTGAATLGGAAGRGPGGAGGTRVFLNRTVARVGRHRRSNVGVEARTSQTIAGASSSARVSSLVQASQESGVTNSGNYE